MLASRAVVGVDGQPVDREAGVELELRGRDPAERVGAAVGDGHERPARDLRVLAGGGQRVDVRPGLGPQRDHAVAEGRIGVAQHAPECAACQHHAPCPASPPPCSGCPPRCSRGHRRSTGRFWRFCGAARPPRRPTAPASAAQPHVSLIVAAYREEAVIEAKVRNALALDWPRERLELIVAVDGGAGPDADGTAERARAAGADQVLELPRGGKVRAQDAGVRAARGDLLAFSDANASWEPDALDAPRRRVRRPGGRLRLRAGALRLGQRDQPGGRLLALRDVAARAGVGAGVGDGGQRRDLRACAARPTSRSTP